MASPAINWAGGAGWAIHTKRAPARKPKKTRNRPIIGRHSIFSQGLEIGAEAVYIYPMEQSVVVIDDEPEIRRFLSKVFQKENFQVYEAETGEVGVKTAQSKLPTLITLDLRL